MSTYELAWGEEYTGKGKPPGGGRWSTARVAVARHDDDDLLLLILLESKENLTMKLHSIERSLHDVSVENFGGVVSLTTVTSDSSVIDRAGMLQEALNTQELGAYCASKAASASVPRDASEWELMEVLCSPQDQRRLLLGFLGVELPPEPTSPGAAGAAPSTPRLPAGRARAAQVTYIPT